MSWDCDLSVSLTIDGNSVSIPCGSWNYTHNTSKMIYDVLGDEGAGKSWYQLLNGKGGAEGAELLSRIVAGLEADPERYCAMNPSNGWGSYDGILEALREMRDASRRWPSAKWSCWG